MCIALPVLARKFRAHSVTVLPTACQTGGAFDPTVSATVDRKAFLGTLYYNYAEAELKVLLDD